jgi:hypothetical protein
LCWIKARGWRFISALFLANAAEKEPAMSLKRTIMVFLTVSVLSAASLHAQLPPLDFEQNKPFPDLILPDLNGEPLSISAFRGQRVVLHIFASW